MIKTLTKVIESGNTHTHTQILINREEVHLLFKRISYLYTSCKGGNKLVGGLIE